MTQPKAPPEGWQGKMNPRLINGLKFIGIIVLVFGGLLLGLRGALFLLPFTLAFVFAQLLEPLIRFVQRKTPLKRPLISIVFCVLFYAALILLAVFLLGKLVDEAASLISNFPQIYANISGQIQNMLADLENELELIHPDAITVLREAMDSLYRSIWTALQSMAVRFASASASNLPIGFLSTIVMIVATVFLTSGRERIFLFLKKQFPNNWVNGALGIRNDLLGALWGYIKAQMKIMIVIAIELIIGFSIIGSRYALLIALGTAVLDALPVFGAGLVLIPSAIWGFITQDFRLGIGCAVMYVCTLVLRQMLEPKVLSNEIGLYPLVTLISMYSGFRLAGIAGLIGGPIIVLVAKNLITAYMAGRTVSEILDGVPPRPEALRLKIEGKKEKQEKGEGGEQENEN